MAPQENIPTQSISNTPSNNGTNFIPLFLVGLTMLVIGFTGGYLLAQNGIKNISPTNARRMQLSPSPMTPTATIKTTDSSSINTYRNDQLGLSFQYPINWKAVNPDPSYPNSPAFVGLVPINQ